MAGLDDESSHGSVGHWGDDADDRGYQREPRQRHHKGHLNDGNRRFDMHRFIQMGPKPLVEGESSDVAEYWLDRMEGCFHVFHNTEEKRLEAINFLVERRTKKWCKSVATPILQEHGRVTWVDFCTAFMKLYFPPTLRQAKSIELLSLKQALCDYLTSYEGLVNKCRQAKISLRWGRSLTSTRPFGSLGPRAQSFKKFGSTTTTSLGSGGVMRFWKKGQCDHCAVENEKVITCMFLLCGIPAFILIDTGASHSFISSQFFKRHKLPYISLELVLSVSTATGQSVLAKCLVVGRPLEFEGNVLKANLMILSMEDFDCILVIDVLNTYRASLYCYQRLVWFHPIGDDSCFFYGEGVRPPIPLVSALRACQALESGGEGYLIYAIGFPTEGVGIGYFPLVNEFPDVFSDEILEFPSVREVEFVIELM
ncbi:uncharacterized protein [Henckelia pumila]|uniref:uncharacterized protein n=1 Tax=Henckelia pumila TaxID=405737 RepID=UPI003C6E3FC5